MRITRRHVRMSPAWLAYHVSDGRWRPARHLIKLAEVEAQVTRHVAEKRPGVLHYMISVPPQHGKTVITSRTWPVFHEGQYPDDHFTVISYEAKFAESHGRAARDTMEEHGPNLYGQSVNPDRHAARDWGLLGHDGGMRCVGIGGAVTGNPSTVLVIDDPIKSHVEANSRGLRDQLFDWYRSSAYTRLAPSAAVFLVMTRWNEDDICGRLLKLDGRVEDGGKWNVIRYPAIADHDPGAGEVDPLGREVGEALWPEVRPLAFLESARESVGSYWFDGMYQGLPRPQGGFTFKRDWFRYFRRETLGGVEVYVLGGDDARLSEGSAGEGATTMRGVRASECWRFCTVDLAASVKTHADHTVCSTWAVTPANDLLLLDVRRAKLEGPQQVPFLEDVYKKYGPSFFAIEAVAYQLAFVSTIRNRGLPVREVNPGREDKAARALHAAAYLEGNKVYWLGEDEGRFPTWLAPWEAELLSFNPGRKDQEDDQVDTFGYATRMVAGGGPQVTVF